MEQNLRITDYFGCYVFGDDAMQKYMDATTYAELKEVIDKNRPLSSDLANRVADAMKEWALDNGATHYTHWFQPLTGTTAEKHDAFISVDKSGHAILEFTGKTLSKGEADASSFPSGGIRATFEARGYTAWDCSSPAFIKKNKNGVGIMYIPTAFCSYNGEALDKKTPLLRSMEALSREAKRLLHILGIVCDKVIPSVGGEQEYFLIDKDDYKKRTDLRFTGRTLFGAMPPKGQEKNDQYYASIRERVGLFMAELNEDLWKLGITAKTQHNEVAPAQHELAPIFSSANIATDQNQLIMETMKKVADKYNLTCLLHEKPFANVNGSGKHNNWSITTDTGINLLKPGKNPSENKVFLLFFTAVIAAIDEYADLVRMSASNPGNEFRLGGNEAPPSIISVYIGDDLEDTLNAIEDGRTVDIAKQRIETGVSYVAPLSKDASDRNRTSPVAFTGNKFEFRMVGSSATLANPNTTFNTIVAEMISRISFQLEGISSQEELDKKVVGIIKTLYKQHKRIIYKGNNYSREWVREAKRRGLVNIDNCIDAYETLLDKKNIALFEKHKVYNKKELASRHEIYLDNYVKTYNIEALTMLTIVSREIMPAVVRYEGELALGVRTLREVNTKLGSVQSALLADVDTLLQQLKYHYETLENAHAVASKAGDVKKQAYIYRDQVIPAMNELRNVSDKLENIIPKNVWPFPTYADILFYE